MKKRSSARRIEKAPTLQRASSPTNKESAPSGSFQSSNKSWPVGMPPISLEALRTMRKASAKVPMTRRFKLIPKRREKEQLEQKIGWEDFNSSWFRNL